jgi:MIP family channel proteins
MLRGTTREAAAEFLGTFILIAFGVGVVAQTVLSRGSAGSFLAINIGWGLAVMLGVYVSAGVSGAHLNPAVTLALAITRGFPWPKVAPYILAQLAGAFVAAAVVYLTYREAFNAFDGGVRQVGGAQGTAGIFATYPQPFLSIAGGFVDQVVGTALLMATIMSVGDQRNNAPPGWMAPVLVGGIVTAIGVAFGFNAGYAINPARDLGPRLFTAVAGWGSPVFSAGGGWSWVPVVAPCIGAVAGAYIYDSLIARNHPPASAEAL